MTPQIHLLTKDEMKYQEAKAREQRAEAIKSEIRKSMGKLRKIKGDITNNDILFDKAKEIEMPSAIAAQPSTEPALTAFEREMMSRLAQHKTNLDADKIPNEPIKPKNYCKVESDTGKDTHPAVQMDFEAHDTDEPDFEKSYLCNVQIYAHTDDKTSKIHLTATNRAYNVRPDLIYHNFQLYHYDKHARLVPLGDPVKRMRVLDEAERERLRRMKAERDADAAERRKAVAEAKAIKLQAKIDAMTDEERAKYYHRKEMEKKLSDLQRSAGYASRGSKYKPERIRQMYRDAQQLLAEHLLTQTAYDNIGDVLGAW